LHNRTGGVEYWTRPGKKACEGRSASLGYDGTELLHVFSSSVQGLKQNGTYDRWAYEVTMRYKGDFRAAARAKAEEGYGTLGRYAKEHHGGDLSAAAKALARQKDEKQREGRTGGYQACDRLTGETCRVSGRPRARVASRPVARYSREVR